MKYFKILIFTSVTLASILYGYATENIDSTVWSDLKSKFPILKTDLYPEGRNLPTKEDFQQIEEALFSPASGHKLPAALVTFYKEVGNLTFTGIYVCTPEGGTNSDFYRLIGEGRRKKIPEDWLAFSKITESEYYCINHKTGQIRYYVVFPELEEDKTYPDLLSWVKMVAYQ